MMARHVPDAEEDVVQLEWGYVPHASADQGRGMVYGLLTGPKSVVPRLIRRITAVHHHHR